MTGGAHVGFLFLSNFSSLSYLLSFPGLLLPPRFGPAPWTRELGPGLGKAREEGESEGKGSARPRDLIGVERRRGRAPVRAGGVETLRRRRELAERACRRRFWTGSGSRICRG